MNEKVIDILKIRGLAGLLVACVAIAPSKAAPNIETISGAGHWLHHDKPDEVLGSIRGFLGLGGEVP